MKLRFESNQQYQLDAIKAIVNIFEGQPKDGGSAVFAERGALEQEGQQVSIEQISARGNILRLTEDQIFKNLHTVQERNGLPKTGRSNGLNFSVEMETGTGKTYVFLRTIHELHQTYGWKKFIIVVPSVAIREGVLKNLDITREHFDELYNKPEMDYYVWDSKKTGQARNFASNDTLQIMVINIDSFAKAENIMNKQSDYGRPLDFIRATNPIVIIDEPQNMETEIRKNAIASLNPLFTLRYSATHKYSYNMVYRLTPVDAYDLGLVKKIEVHSVLSEDSYNTAYVSLIKIERSGKRRLLAKLEIDASDERGLQRKIITVAPGDNLAQLTKRTIYDGYIVETIDYANQAVEFSNGKIIYVGQKDEGLHEEILKRQIELTVEDHFEKQKRLNAEGVKVLSLFFIDKVANYREYTESGWKKGKFAIWFEEAYAKISAMPKYAGVMGNLRPEDVHNGYFAADKNGHWKDSKDSKGEGGKTKDDDDAYKLIMKDKERLLDISEPLRFIFSHSALREGWDNPNVFNICTLNETSSEMKKRQEIGRGLRLPVNANGERVRDESINILTVIANESYADFSRKLQTEIEEETGITFGEGRIKDRNKRIRVTLRKNVSLDPSFKELWGKIKHKTTYKVNINVEELIHRAIEELGEVSISRPQLSNVKTLIEKIDEEGFKTSESIGAIKAVSIDEKRIPDILAAIQNRTMLTRRVIFEILDKSGMFDLIPVNPQQVIDEVSRIINRVKQELAVDGIKYEKTGEIYNVSLFKDEELGSYLYDAAVKSGAIAVEKPEKTVYDHVIVDSENEREFLNALEQTENVKFYVKLPSWFKIDTPLGTYNPDWAVVFDGDERIYFVAETKEVDEINDGSLRDAERGKIKAGRKHFDEIGIPFAAPVSSLQAALRKLNVH